MHLYLSHRSPWNSVYTNELGQVLYQVETPMSIGTRTSTIKRVVPNHDPGDMSNKFEVIGQVEHHSIRSSILRFQGNEIETKSFFRKGKGRLSSFGRDRVFTAPNGREYKWRLGAMSSSLATADHAKAPAAIYHRPLIQIRNHGSLEICAAGEDIVPTIMVTFIYVEKLRQERKESSTSGGG